MKLVQPQDQGPGACGQVGIDCVKVERGKSVSEHLLLCRKSDESDCHARKEIEHNLKVDGGIVCPHCVSSEGSGGQSVQRTGGHTEGASACSSDQNRRGGGRRRVRVQQTQHSKRALVNAHKGSQIASVLKREPRNAESLFTKSAVLKQDIGKKTKTKREKKKKKKKT